MSDPARPNGSQVSKNTVSSNAAAAPLTEQRSLRQDLLQMILRKEAERRAALKPNFEIKPRQRVELRFGA